MVFEHTMYNPQYFSSSTRKIFEVTVSNRWQKIVSIPIPNLVPVGEKIKTPISPL